MSEKTFSIEIPLDSDGYAMFECPFCESEFKLMGAEYKADDQSCNELFCPYCGLADSFDKFYTKEFVEHINELIQNYKNELLNGMLGGMAKKINKNKNITMKFKPLKNKTIAPITSSDITETEEIIQCEICTKSEKVAFYSGHSKVFCAYCGVGQ